MIAVAINIVWGRERGGWGGGGEGFQQFPNDSTTKLMATGYIYLEHKCTLQTPFSYLSQKILARVEDMAKALDLCAVATKRARTERSADEQSSHG